MRHRTQCTVSPYTDLFLVSTKVGLATLFESVNTRRWPVVCPRAKLLRGKDGKVQQANKVASFELMQL